MGTEVPTTVGSVSSRRSCVAAAPRIAASAPRLEDSTGGTAPLPPSTRVDSSAEMTGASHCVIGAKMDNAYDVLEEITEQAPVCV